jgi:hypothetical protein
VRIADVTVSETAEGAKLGAVAVWDAPSLPPEPIYFVYRGVGADALAAPGDALASAMVIPCMALGEDLIVDAPVSTKLQSGIRTIVDIFLSWGRGPYRTRLQAPDADRSTLHPAEIGACWSGGADSFHTILRERDEPITTLLTMVGYDMRHEKRPIFEGFLPRLSSAAERMGREMIVVDTNVYEVGRRHLGNAAHHGAVLAAMALGISGRLRRFHIPSSWAYRLMKPHGSHPFIDPLWSSESLEVIHDSPELCKIERVTAIAHSDVVLDTLRVCSRFPERYNCGLCDKCVFVALVLHQEGTLDRCSTLPRPSPAHVVRRMLISPEWRTRFEMLRDHIDDPEYKRALAWSLRTSRLLTPARPVSKVLRKLGLRH